MKPSEVKPGDRFGLLTVQSIQQHYRNGKKNGFEAICLCDCGNQKVIVLSNLVSGNTSSCGCLSIQSSKNNLKYANAYLSSHPEIMVENGCKIGPENIKYAHAYFASHPEICQEIGSKNVKHALESQRRDPNFESSLQKEYRLFLEQNNIHFETEFLLDNHYFDFKVNNFLIEINGDIYHSSKYENLLNPSANGPSVHYKSQDHHKSLLDLASSHGYRLIQLWEYKSPSFNKQLLFSRLQGDANINDFVEYLNDRLVICNDYGFNVEGDYLPDPGKWISTSSHEVVTEYYPRGRVLVYNSGYTVLD